MWTVSEDGRHLYDDGECDVRLDVDGNWPSCYMRLCFARNLAAILNAADTPKPAPGVCYMPCNAHMGMSWKMTIKSTATPAFVTVCPICNPPLPESD